MLWTILALILLAVIAGLFWWRQKQEQKWRQELAQLSGDEQELNEEDSPVAFSDQLNSLKRLFSMNKRTADNHKIARIRLLSALEHNKTQRAETDEEHTTEPVTEEPEHIAATEEEIKIAPKTRKPAKPERIPKITPFAQMEAPKYSPSLVQNSNFEEITLEEATRSLHEAAVEEWNEHLAEKNAPIYKDEVETPLIARFIPADDGHGNHRLQRSYLAPHTRACLGACQQCPRSRSQCAAYRNRSDGLKDCRKRSHPPLYFHAGIPF